jgi:hypothetical protein
MYLGILATILATVFDGSVQGYLALLQLTALRQRTSEKQIGMKQVINR